MEAPSRIRHYFWLTAPTDSPASWRHLVNSDDESSNYIDVTQARARPGGGRASARSILRLNRLS